MTPDGGQSRSNQETLNPSAVEANAGPSEVAMTDAQANQMMKEIEEVGAAVGDMQTDGIQQIVSDDYPNTTDIMRQ